MRLTDEAVAILTRGWISRPATRQAPDRSCPVCGERMSADPMEEFTECDDGATITQTWWRCQTPNCDGFDYENRETPPTFRLCPTCGGMGVDVTAEGDPPCSDCAGHGKFHLDGP